MLSLGKNVFNRNKNLLKYYKMMILKIPELKTIFAPVSYLILRGKRHRKYIRRNYNLFLQLQLLFDENLFLLLFCFLFIQSLSRLFGSLGLHITLKGILFGI